VCGHDICTLGANFSLIKNKKKTILHGVPKKEREEILENLEIAKPRPNTLESHGQCIIDYLEKNCDCTKFD
jgi:hypothetical protein